MENYYIPKAQLFQFKSISIMRTDFGFDVLYQNSEYLLVWRQVSGKNGKEYSLTPPKKSLEELEDYCSSNQAEILFAYFGPDEAAGITDEQIAALTMVS